MTPPPAPPNPQLAARLIVAIMLGVLLWGTALAIGAYLYNQNIWRGVIVFACTAGFIELWMLLLLIRGRRPKRMEGEPKGMG